MLYLYLLVQFIFSCIVAYVFILVPTLHKFWEKTKLHNNHVNWNASNMLSNLVRIRVKVKNNVSGNHIKKTHESENCNSGWSPVKNLFWICSFWKVKYFFLASIGWKLYNYAFFSYCHQRLRCRCLGDKVFPVGSLFDEKKRSMQIANESESNR